MDGMVNLTKMLKFKNQNNPQNKENLTIHPNLMGSLYFNFFICTTFLSIVMKWCNYTYFCNTYPSSNKMEPHFWLITKIIDLDVIKKKKKKVGDGDHPLCRGIDTKCSTQQLDQDSIMCLLLLSLVCFRDQRIWRGLLLAKGT